MAQELMTLPNVSVMPCQLLLQGLRAALTPVPHIVQLWIVSISSPAKYRPTQRLGIPRVPTRVVGLEQPAKSGQREKGGALAWLFRERSFSWRRSRAARDSSRPSPAD